MSQFIAKTRALIDAEHAITDVREKKIAAISTIPAASLETMGVTSSMDPLEQYNKIEGHLLDLRKKYGASIPEGLNEYTQAGKALPELTGDVNDAHRALQRHMEHKFDIKTVHRLSDKTIEVQFSRDGLVSGARQNFSFNKTTLTPENVAKLPAHEAWNDVGINQEAEGMWAKFTKMHWGAKTAIVGGTAAVGAFIAYNVFKEKQPEVNQISR